MKETELRLNNLFVQAGSNFVETVTFETFELLSRDAIKIGGIPLTEEWLLKCGFKHYLHGYRLKSIVLEQHSSIYYKIRGYNHKTNIGYIHQLQNLYFDLTGEELQINL